MNPQKIIIVMPTEEELMPSISRWVHEYAWAQRDAYFIYVVRKNIDVGETSVDETPNKVVQAEIKRNMLNFIKNKAREMMPSSAFQKAQFEVLFAQSPADRLAEYAKEINAGLIVVATRNKKGFSRMFLSSFADRLLKLSLCDVLVLITHSAPRNKPWGIFRWLSASIRPKGREMLAPSSNVHFLPNRNVRRFDI
ncbi:MAG: universal stress protein [Candidatus Nitrotoga sp.]|nr:universal stress protein [Candidatus Nitrotoga sp.]